MKQKQLAPNKKHKVGLRIVTDGEMVDTQTDYTGIKYCHIAYLISAIEKLKAELIGMMFDIPPSYEIKDDNQEVEEDEDKDC